MNPSQRVNCRASRAAQLLLGCFCGPCQSHPIAKFVGLGVVGNIPGLGRSTDGGSPTAAVVIFRFSGPASSSGALAYRNPTGALSAIQLESCFEFSGQSVPAWARLIGRLQFPCLDRNWPATLLARMTCQSLGSLVAAARVLVNLLRTSWKPVPGRREEMN